MKLLCVIALFFSSLMCAGGVFADAPLRNDRFGTIGIEQGSDPKGPVVIIFSGDANETSATLKSITPKISLAIELDTDRYVDGINRHDGKDQCTYLAGEIERLGQSAQSSQSLEQLRSPFLIGIGKGAALAYAVYAEHPLPFSGLATLGNTGSIQLQVPVCKGDKISPEYDKQKQLVSFSTSSDLPGKNFAVPSDATASQKDNWFSGLAKFLEIPPGIKTENVVDLPVIEIRAKNETPDTPLVIFLSGDGGWAAIDKEIGRYLSGQGIDVVGFDCLKYFWSRKTAEQTANDVARVISAYQKAWHKNKIILAGFSLGAEHVPFVLTNLPDKIRGAIELAVMLSPGKDTDFEIHIADWLGIDNSDGIDLVAPEIKKARGVPMLCIYGKDEAADSSCVGLPADAAEVISLPGGHHLNDDYTTVGGLILARIKHSS